MKTLHAVVAGIAMFPVASSAVEPPVTRSEASAVFGRTQKVLKSVLKLPADIPVFSGGDGVATREQVLRHFDRISRIVEPLFKFTPPKVKAAVPYISFKDPEAKKIAERLEVMGFLDRYGALATSKAEGMDPKQFGDAIGFFVARVAELTHTPSTRFSPYLMPGGGPPPSFDKNPPPN